MITFVPHEMQGAVELTPEIKNQLQAANGWDELEALVYDLMVMGAEIGMAAQMSGSDHCFSDCPTNNLPAYLPGLCDCEARRG